MNGTDIRYIIEYTRTNGGCTVASGSISESSTGYVVGGKVPTVIVPESDTVALHNTIVQFANTYDSYGTWLHDGNVYIDAIDILYDRDSAIALGRARGELAIYDIANGCDIDTSN